MLITSRSNSLLRQIRAVRDGDVAEFIFVEGLRLSAEVLRSDLSLEAVVVSEELARKDRAVDIVHELEHKSRRFATVSERLLESISYTKTPQGIVLLAGRPPSGPARLETALGSCPLLVVMHELNNPVNVGAVLRTAEAAGATGVITTRNTSDPFSPKSLRGAMGSAFRLPIWSGADFEKVMEWCRANNIRTVCADSAGTNDHTQIDWTLGSAIVLGPESTGLEDDEISLATTSVRIPMSGPVESLNVSVAAGIVLYEAVRQRGFQS